MLTLLIKDHCNVRCKLICLISAATAEQFRGQLDSTDLFKEKICKGGISPFLKEAYNDTIMEANHAGLFLKWQEMLMSS